VLVAAPGRAPSAEQEVVVPEPGAPPAIADFELSAGGRLRGEVRDARTRAPIAGAEIVIEGQVDLGPSLLPVRARAVSGPDGRFELSGVPDRLLSLQASAPDHHARLVAGLVVEDGEVRGPVVVDLTPLAPGEEPGVELTGIGAGLAARRDALVVTSVLPQGGAAEAGLVPGDEIVRIDGRLVDDLTMAAAVNLIRGPENSSVILGVRRRGDASRTEQRIAVVRRLVRSDQRG
jgi:membrane-associated protease RseP (regulator of RpoE activity)